MNQPTPTSAARLARAVLQASVMPKTTSKTRRAPAKRKKSQGVTTKLSRYQQKRDFEQTPEPSGRAGVKANKAGLSFVVQKHAASHLHYDFRLELDGVLLSWAVPKGPSVKPGLRRLAMRVEDHPLDYADFEGIIPEGQYGGGTVIVWDHGTWEPEEEPHRSLEKGRLTFDLHGEKLHGRFHLVRTKPTARGGREQWLLFKGKGEGASDELDIAEERAESVISGRTIEQVREDPERVWQSNRAEKTAPKNKKKPPVASKAPALDTLQLVKQLPVKVALTNLDKVLYPESKLRKADVIAYYAAVCERMLPHVRGRPLTLVRCPNGAGAKCFFQKHASDSTPDVIERVPIEENHERAEYMAIRDLDGLIALAQMGVLEVHTWGCHKPAVEKPDKLVIDIDPDQSVPWERVVEAAFELRERLEGIGLTSFVQTTGGKGLHVVAPLQPRLSWDEHKQLAFALAEDMARAQPKRYLTNMKKSLRKGRIFLDYLRNGRGATAVAPYSTRARTHATVAAPITWDELEGGAKPADFTLRSMIERTLPNARDPWSGYDDVKQSIARTALRKLG
jgi:bifunctional non-homologous end joining protein LigD